ncbi:MAG: ATP-dependent DNA helicase RecG [Nitrospira sp.]|nr:ATP-dependent DNA helicase RecG [Nitrospira sp.]
MSILQPCVTIRPGMQTLAESDAAARLLSGIERLARPIEFATRDQFAYLDTVKNLGLFVSTQIRSLLANQPLPPPLEAQLRALQDLFIDFHSSLAQAEQRRRLKRAAAMIQVLRDMVLGRSTQVARDHAIASTQPDDGERDNLWAIPIRFVKGVGPKRAEVLRRWKIETVEDALWTVPWRYEDRSVVTPLGRLIPGLTATVCGTVEHCHVMRTKNRRVHVIELLVRDQSGSAQAVFFNQPYLQKVFAVGTRVMMGGRVTAGRQGWTMPRLEVAHYEVIGEEMEVPLHVGRIVPIYHETKGWSSRQMRVLEKTLLDTYARNLHDHLPAALRARCRLLPLRQALYEVHFPRPGTDLRLLDQSLTPAHRRLAFEEMFLLQLALAVRRKSVRDEPKTVRFTLPCPLVEKLRGLLPFRLTPAQERVIQEIVGDMVSPRPMNRLVQGDVGSGKTAVALYAITLACGSGYQAALMAPTEILAEQHYRNLAGMFDALGISAVLVRGGGRSSVKGKQEAALAAGAVQVAIGTHALIQKDVVFKNLGLAVVDEQHKFGVIQRKMLIEKGYRPDVLVMTATPIPRTLAMTVYGDLDVSIIDMLPPGRKPVQTLLFGPAQRRRALHILRDELARGRQAYVVYPLVEESEKTDLQAAIQGAERLKREDLAEFRVGLVHGRLKAAERESVMAEFKAGAIQVLVATTVIEVGVDVPNATVMMIEHAERFGLAQLHQLRGRVGRSQHQSYCLLMTGAVGRAGGPARWESAESFRQRSSVRERLEVLVRSNDGFVIAEEDLRLRGPGEFLGVRQWGVPEFRVADVVRDGDLLSEARREAEALLLADPTLTDPTHRDLREAVVRVWGKKLDLGLIG